MKANNAISDLVDGQITIDKKNYFYLSRKKLLIIEDLLEEKGLERLIDEMTTADRQTISADALAAELFDNKIKLYRKKAGLTQKELANRIGIPQSNISRWESGAIFPKGINLQKLALIFDCDVEELFLDE